MLFGLTCFTSETDHAIINSFLFFQRRRRRRRAAVQHSAATQTGTDQDTYYTALPAHIPLLGGIGRRTDHGDDGGPSGGGGGTGGLTAAMPCWPLLAAAKLGTTVAQQLMD